MNDSRTTTWQQCLQKEAMIEACLNKRDGQAQGILRLRGTKSDGGLTVSVPQKRVVGR